MKNLFTKLFWPILRRFEQGEGDYNYSKSRRIILLVFGSLMLLLSSGVAPMITKSGELIVLLPTLVFFGLGLLCFVVGFLGSDRAVAKLWGNK